MVSLDKSGEFVDRHAPPQLVVSGRHAGRQILVDPDEVGATVGIGERVGDRHLARHDPWVLGFMARAVWRCPSPPVVERYHRHVGRRHLDVGPGTGYFLDKAGLPDETQVTLLDPNPNVLIHAARRLPSIDVTTAGADVLPLPVEGRFDSVALNYVLHCLPGPQSRKAVAIRNVAAVLAPDGVLFGGTVLGGSEKHTLAARVTLWAFNRQGAFDKLGDTAEGLRQVLEESFQTVEIDVVGSVAHFTARADRTDPSHSIPADLVRCAGSCSRSIGMSAAELEVLSARDPRASTIRHDLHRGSRPASANSRQNP